MGGQLWEVVGGSDKGGIVVRSGRELTSPQAAERLSTSALVEELERHGERLHYKLLAGTGPSEGWVSLKLKDKVLLEQRNATRSQSAKPAPVPQNTQHPKPKSSAQQKAEPLEKPKDPKPKPSAQQKVEPAEKRSTNDDSPHDYQARLADLRERYAHLELDVPYDAYKWTPEELENYFESGGFIKPVKTAKQETAPEHKPRQERKTSVPDVPQFSRGEALKIQTELKGGFSNKDFQQALKTLQGNFPNRKSRGHADVAAYFEAFEALTMTVYHAVLPKYDLSGDWNGVNDMFAKMETQLSDRTIKKLMEEINALLGLPRDAVFKPNIKVSTFVFCPAGNAPSMGFTRQLVQDDDGDEAHEFLVEDPATGELRKVGSSALDA